MALTDPIAMKRGVPLKVVDVGAVGTTKSQKFTPPNTDDQKSLFVTLQRVGAAATMTVAYTVSFDGGANYGKIGATLDLVASPVVQVQVPGGGSHRLDIQIG